MMHPDDKSTRPTHPIIAKWCIWSIENQPWLAGRMRIYIWGAVTTVGFFTFVGLIKLETALWSLFLSGILICATLFFLIRQRKIWLLSIQTPELRQQALNAMVNYLHAVNHAVPVRGYCRHTSKEGSREPSDRSHPNLPIGHN